MSMKLQPDVEQGAHAALARLLHEIGYGVMLVEADGRVAYANRLATTEMHASRTLAEVDGRLTTAHAAQKRALAEALASAIAGRYSLLELGVGSDARMFVVMPLAAGDAPTDAALVLCSRPDAIESLTVAMYAKAVGLTAAEQAVLAGLCGGLAVSDIANRQSVQVSTVRTHVSRIREKTGARTVLQVIRRMSMLPPVLSRVG